MFIEVIKMFPEHRVGQIKIINQIMKLTALNLIILSGNHAPENQTLGITMKQNAMQFASSDIQIMIKHKT